LVGIPGPGGFLEKFLMQAPGPVERQGGDLVDKAVHGILQ
jgi:hypothetical protein